KADVIHYDANSYRLLGWTPREGGYPLAEVRARVHPDDLPAVAASVERALRSDVPTVLEARYRHADASWRMILNRPMAERAASGEPVAFIGVGLDITERVESARSALELARRLEAISRASRLGTWTLDLESGEALWNPRMFDLYGVPRGDRPLTWPELLE